MESHVSVKSQSSFFSSLSAYKSWYWRSLQIVQTLWSVFVLHCDHEEQKPPQEWFLQKLTPHFISVSLSFNYCIRQNVQRVSHSTISMGASHGQQKGHVVRKIHPWSPGRQINLLNSCGPFVTLITKLLDLIVKLNPDFLPSCNNVTHITAQALSDRHIFDLRQYDVVPYAWGKCYAVCAKPW